MKITAVDTEWVPVRRQGQSYRWRQGLPEAVPETERLLLRIRTDEGAEDEASVRDPLR